MNTKGFTDPDVWMSPGTIFLTLLVWAGLVTGYVMSKRMDSGALPLWMVLVVMVAIPFVAYHFANQG